MTDMLTAKEAAALLGVPVRSFYLLPIPEVPGRRPRMWGLDDINSFLRDSYRPGAGRGAAYQIAAADVPRKLDADVEALLESHHRTAVRAPAPPFGPAVYFLFDGGELVYVGQTTNMARRLAQHSKLKKFDSFSFIACSENDLRAIETYAIAKYRPPLNRT
jgi:hypothetical protein